MHYVKGKGYIDVRGQKVCSKRTMALRLAKVYGHENDTAAFTRLIIESRVSRELMNKAFMDGRQSGADQAVVSTLLDASESFA